MPLPIGPESHRWRQSSPEWRRKGQPLAGKLGRQVTVARAFERRGDGSSGSPASPTVPADSGSFAPADSGEGERASAPAEPDPEQEDSHTPLNCEPAAASAALVRSSMPIQDVNLPRPLFRRPCSDVPRAIPARSTQRLDVRRALRSLQTRVLLTQRRKPTLLFRVLRQNLNTRGLGSLSGRSAKSDGPVTQKFESVRTANREQKINPGPNFCPGYHHRRGGYFRADPQFSSSSAIVFL